MTPDLMRLFVEKHIAETRPASGLVAGAGLVFAGVILARMSFVFLLTGLFVGGSVLLLGLFFLGAGLGCVLLAWGICRGYVWTWYAAILSPIAWLAFSWWLPQAYPRLSTALLILVLAIQPMLWHGSLRGWVFRAYWLRSHGFDGVVPAFPEPRPPMSHDHKGSDRRVCPVIQNPTTRRPSPDPHDRVASTPVEEPP